MSFGLLPSGFKVKRASDVLESLRQRIVDELDARNLPTDVDFERDTVAGVMTDALSVTIGECWEAAGAVYDQFDPSSARFAALDNIGALRNIRRLGEEASRVDLTLVGTSGTIVPAGSIVQGGGPDGEARWSTVETVTISAGVASVEGVCTEVGAINAGAGEIDQIVTPISGWAGVSNAAPAVPGRTEEPDGPYRLRQRREIRPVGGRSAGAIRQALLEVSGVQSVSVLENRSSSPVTIGTKDLDPHSVLPIIFPAGLTASQQEAVALALWDWGPSGIRVGYSGGTDNSVTVEGEGFEPTAIGWDDATAVNVDVVMTLTLAPGVLLADVQSQVEEAVTDYFAALDVGEAVRRLQIQRTVGRIEGIDAITFTLNASGSDLVVDTDEIAILDSLSVS